MFNKVQNLIILLCIISCIYILRNNYTSPTNLLLSLATRLLQGPRPSVSLCDGVEIESDNTDSDSDIYRTALSALQNGNRLVVFIKGPLPASDFGSEYIVPMIKYSIPWLVFFGISIITCLAYLFVWCCCRHSKSERFKKTFFIFGLVFLLFIIGASIAGLVVSRGFSEGGKRSLCKAALLFEELAYGETTNWIGIRSAAEKVTTVLDSFNSTINNLEDLDNDFDEMEAAIQPALAAVQNMYDDDKNRTVTRPNPEIGGIYIPSYIQNLGPLSRISTVTGAIQNEIQTKLNIVEEASKAINSTITELRQNQAQFQQYLTTGRDLAEATIASVDVVLIKVEEFGNDADDIIDIFNGAFLGIFISQLVIATFATLVIVLVCCGIKFFKKCVHISWCAIGLICILTWVLAVIVYPFGLITSEACEVADLVIIDPKFFDITFNKFISVSTDYASEKARQLVKECMFGDGEVLVVFDLEGKVNMFDPIFQALDDTANLTNTVQPVPDSIAIPDNEQLIQSLEEGTTPDSPEAEEDLVTLNSFIENNARQCDQVQDVWALNSAQCSPGSGLVFTAANVAGFNMGNQTCIGFNMWGNRDIEGRYNTTTLPPDNCGSTDAYLSNFVSRFVQSRQEVEDIFDDLQDDLGSVATANSAFMNSVKAVTRRFNPIREDTLTVYNALANKTTGLLSNTNCLFVREAIYGIRNSLCVVTAPSLFNTAVITIVLSFMGLFATFFIFCLARKLSIRRKKGGRQLPETGKSPKAK